MTFANGKKFVSRPVMPSWEAIFRMMRERGRDYSKLQKIPGVVFVSVASRLLDICERQGTKIYCS